jgi:argininosuccinate synthase
MEPAKDVYSKTVDPEDAPDKPARIVIEFKDGIPVKVENLGDGAVETKPLALFMYLNQLGSAHGIGRVDMVENRFVGIKSRGIYETPGGTILHAAHKDIEGVAMDREVMRLRDMLTAKLSELVYYGFWFSPEMDFLMAVIDKSQEVIDGKVYLKLFKGNVFVTGISIRRAGRTCVQIPYPATSFGYKIPFVTDPGLWSNCRRLAKLTPHIGS